MKEDAIEFKILQWLNANGVFAWKVNVRGYYDEKRGFWRKNNNIYAINGQSDIVGVLPDGKLLAIEVKGKKTRVSLDQEHFIHCVKEKDGVAFIARSIQDVIDGLELFGYINK